jgi:hypothetical protein
MATKTEQPSWQISRGFVGPFGRVFFRPIFTLKARTQDQAIERAAYKVKGIAMLKATRLPPKSDSDATAPHTFFLCVKLSKK